MRAGTYLTQAETYLMRAGTATTAGSAAVPHPVGGLSHDPQPAANRTTLNSGFFCYGHH